MERNEIRDRFVDIVPSGLRCAASGLRIALRAQPNF
jgi:hypothetical protein